MPDRRLLTVVVAALFAPAGARAAEFGPIEVVADREPPGNSAHGYTEYRFLVRNKGDSTHHVELRLPAEKYLRRGSGGIVDVRRSGVTVAAGHEAVISLLHPARPAVSGAGVAVVLNGREQETTLPLTPRSAPGGHPYGRPGRWGRVARPTILGGSEQLVLLSKRVPEAFVQRTPPARPVPGRAGGLTPAGPSKPTTAMPPPPPRPAVVDFDPDLEPTAPPMVLSGQFVRADVPVSRWSPNWLAYTRYAGLVLTSDDIGELERGDNAAKAALQAIWEYVEAGGAVLIVGSCEYTGPETWRGTAVRHFGRQATFHPLGQAVPAPWPPRLRMTTFHVGLGRCLISHVADPLRWSPTDWGLVQTTFSASAAPIQATPTLMELNDRFPVVDELGVPVKGLFALMLLFAVGVGPVNLIVLARTNRRIWMLWVVPLVSALTCAAVFGYMIVAEGWQGHASVGGITLLDESARRATSFGRSAYYSPLTPAGGLHFSPWTEVQPQGGEHSAYTSSCAIDWTHDQHLSRGWVTARVPAHFAMRKSETRFERVMVDRKPHGGLEARNALGVDLRELWLADEAGRLYHAGPVPAGQAVKLEPTGQSAAKVWPGEAWRKLYTTVDWTTAVGTVAKAPGEYLGPRTYLAVMDRTPFLEQGLNGARVRENTSVVVGLLAEVGKGK